MEAGVAKTIPHAIINITIVRIAVAKLIHIFYADFGKDRRQSGKKSRDQSVHPPHNGHLILGYWRNKLIKKFIN